MAVHLDQKIINDIKDRLVKVYNPSEIYLLEPHSFSEDDDIDILIIVEKASTQRYDLMAEGHKALIGIKIAKNILVYTREEFDDYSKDSSTLSYLIKKNGVIIYAKT